MATREQLIRAAMRAFAEEGFDAPSLDSICDRAGLTRGAFYVHFRDRDDLIVAVVERTRRWTMDAMLAPGMEELGLEKIIRLFVDAVGRGAYPPPAGVVRQHHFMDAIARSKPIRERHIALAGEAHGRLTEVVRRAQRAGEMRTDVEPGAFATVLLALVSGVETMLETGVPLDVARAAETVLRLMKPSAIPAIRLK